MTQIDPIRRAARLRRASRPEADEAEEVQAARGSNLPVPVDAARTIPPPTAEPPPSAAAYDAQLLGQDGEKRGLRAGPSLIDTAAHSYNRAEWSGSKDRRARKGGIAKTDI